MKRKLVGAPMKPPGVEKKAPAKVHYLGGSDTASTNCGPPDKPNRLDAVPSRSSAYRQMLADDASGACRASTRGRTAGKSKSNTSSPVVRDVVLEALIAVDNGQPLDLVLRDFERLSPETYKLTSKILMGTT